MFENSTNGHYKFLKCLYISCLKQAPSLSNQILLFIEKIYPIGQAHVS